MVTVVDYNAGNLTSVRRALGYLGAECEITGEPEKIAAAERVIFPGVGNAESAMRNLNESGIADALRRAVFRGAPFLGICLGMQIMLSHSDEGNVDCLNLFEGGVRLLKPDKGLKIPRADRNGQVSLKIPHMGWDRLKYLKDHELFDGIEPRSEFYFVHSYYAEPSNAEDTVALSDHGVEFAAVIGRGNMFAVQFHPEKSGAPGLKILENFISWNPR
ncbi:MAG: imidazole glycerol phosphate synthase subunit HisH [Clostridiales bacterium]|jgi:glutamine amidotransferase|nr:imidazole glycerol phosphate synthase subunit HisH [Clostridiales bacterium]